MLDRKTNKKQIKKFIIFVLLLKFGFVSGGFSGEYARLFMALTYRSRTNAVHFLCAPEKDKRKKY